MRELLFKFFYLMKVCNLSLKSAEFFLFSIINYYVLFNLANHYRSGFRWFQGTRKKIKKIRVFLASKSRLTKIKSGEKCNWKSKIERDDWKKLLISSSNSVFCNSLLLIPLRIFCLWSLFLTIYRPIISERPSVLLLLKFSLVLYMRSKLIFF